MKRYLDDLALFGGDPAFPAAERLIMGRPNIGDRDSLFGRIGAALDRRWLSNRGTLVQEFEQRIAEISGARFCVAMCNGTLALQVTIKAMALTGEVIVPSFTFAATAHAVAWLGLTPVFCDVDLTTQLMSPAHAERLITPETSGIVGVHLWGQPCQVECLTDISRRHGLALIFDGAHAFGCTLNGLPLCRFGDATIFSFHATKFVNSFEGGALVTDDEALARRVLAMQNFGQEEGGEVNWIGTNAKMSEAAAAMGLTSLDIMPDVIVRNRSNYRGYSAGLTGIDGIRLLALDNSENNAQYVIVEVDECATGISRDALCEVLRAENVICGRYFRQGCHMMPPYGPSPPLPNTEALTGRVLGLPTGTAVGPGQVAQLCELIRFAVAHGHEIGRRLPCHANHG